MQKWPSATRFRISSNTLAKTFDDKVALAHLQTKRFHVLNPTTASIWKAICAGNSRIEMENALRDEYDVDPVELTNEIDRILIMLHTEDFISAQP